MSLRKWLWASLAALGTVSCALSPGLDLPVGGSGGSTGAGANDSGNGGSINFGSGGASTQPCPAQGISLGGASSGAGATETSLGKAKIALGGAGGIASETEEQSGDSSSTPTDAAVNSALPVTSGTNCYRK